MKPHELLLRVSPLMAALFACGEATVVCPDGQVLVADAYCTDVSVVCGEGTVEYEGKCVGFDPNDVTAPVTIADPPGSVSLAPPQVVVLTADEPANIYYTVDGSTPTKGSAHAASPLSVFDVAPDGVLQFFAVDLAGNAGEVESETYGVDGEGPAPVTELEANVDGGTIAVSWQNPDDPDFAGVLVVRSVVTPTLEPVTAETYAPGNVGGAEDIVFVGSATDLTDDAPFPGFDRYTIWTYDQLGNFGVPVWTTTPQPIPVAEQTGTIEIDVSTGAVTVVTQPTSFTISGTSTVDIAQQAIDATFELESAVGRPFFNTKLLFESVSEGTVDGDGLLMGTAFAHYGVRALATGERRSASVTLNGITFDQSPVVLTVKIRDDPVIVHVSGQSLGSFGLADASGVGASSAVSCAPVAWEQNFSSRCNFRDAVFSQDGRFIYASNGWSSSVAAIDSSTLAVVAGVDLHPSGGVGSVAALARSPDGKYLYALVTLNGHYRGGGSVQGHGGGRVVDLVKLDASTLLEVARLELMSPGQTGVAMRNLSLTADGTIAAAISQSLNTLFIIDLAEMVLVGSTSTSAFATSPSAVAIEPDGSHVWIGSRSNSTSIFRVERVGFAVDEVILPTSVSRPSQIAFGPDGLLYYGRKNASTTTAGLTLVDPDALTVVGSLYLNHAVKGIAFSADGSVAYLAARDLALNETIIATFDTLTHTPIGTFSAHGGTERSGHWLGVSPF